MEAFDISAESVGLCEEILVCASLGYLSSIQKSPLTAHKCRCSVLHRSTAEVKLHSLSK